jgi:hypothetical protein
VYSQQRFCTLNLLCCDCKMELKMCAVSWMSTCMKFDSECLIFKIHTHKHVSSQSELKVNLYMCRMKYHAMNAYWEGGGGVALLFQKTGARWRCVVTIMLQPLYSWRKSWKCAVRVDRHLFVFLCCFYLRTYFYCWMIGWVGLRFSVVWRREICCYC